MTDPTAMTDAPAAEPAAAAPAAAPAADAAAAEPVKPSGKSPFEIKKWNPVFMWSWDVESDTCSICRGNLNELCLECQTKPTGSDCTIAWGVCNVCHNSSFFPFFFVFGFFTTFDLFFFFLFAQTARFPLPLHFTVAQAAQELSSWFVLLFLHIHLIVFTHLNSDNTEWEYQKVSK